ncbi:putative mitochondrial protein [Sesamum angolense]|uniref:Mitochondrial protein n=1 Tax=Sesamum angolense TaxID=2727404 RepID=A0AAE1WAP9_9LAMI|nr:putative mitochondrial protein [Sesamum angolense]
MEQKKGNRGQTGQRALNANCEIGEGSSQSTTTAGEAGANFTKLIRLELRRLMCGEEQGEEVCTNFVDYEDFAGTRKAGVGRSNAIRGGTEPRQVWKKPIGCHWFYKIKLRPHGAVDRYKARLVAKCYNQVEGVDYIDCFAPVAKAATVRMFLAVTTARDLGATKYFLGLEIARSSQGLIVTQNKYIQDIVKDAGLVHCKAATTPLPADMKFSQDSGEVLPDPSKYRRLIGRVFVLKLYQI